VGNKLIPVGVLFNTAQHHGLPGLPTIPSCAWLLIELVTHATLGRKGLVHESERSSVGKRRCVGPCPALPCPALPRPSVDTAVAQATAGSKTAPPGVDIMPNKTARNLRRVPSIGSVAGVRRVSVSGCGWTGSTTWGSLTTTWWRETRRAICHTSTSTSTTYPHTTGLPVCSFRLLEFLTLRHGNFGSGRDLSCRA
jgi:hypothetical protein